MHLTQNEKQHLFSKSPNNKRSNPFNNLNQNFVAQLIKKKIGQILEYGRSVSVDRKTKMEKHLYDFSNVDNLNIMLFLENTFQRFPYKPSSVF
jgi:hypothetical protein